MRNMKWKALAAAAIAVLASGGVGGIAAASEPDTKALDYVDGLDGVNDDWNDHPEELGGSLCDGCDYSDNTDLVVLWQSVLAADGFLAEADSIDGYFGPDTQRATAMWQDFYGVEQTGEVDFDTWAEASDHLSLSENDVVYDGRRDGEVVLFRHDDADGTYTFIEVTTDGGDNLVNVGGNKIEHFNRTIELGIT